MPTLKEYAESYEVKKTRNISELAVVPVELDLKDGSFTDNTGQIIAFKFVELNGERYRVPNTVIADLKQIMATKPGVTKVKVNKFGTGKTGTKYTVIPLD